MTNSSNNNKISYVNKSQQYNSSYLLQLLNITRVPILIICAIDIYCQIFLDIWVWE